MFTKLHSNFFSLSPRKQINHTFFATPRGKRGLWVGPALCSLNQICPDPTIVRGLRSTRRRLWGRGAKPPWGYLSSCSAYSSCSGYCFRSACPVGPTINWCHFSTIVNSHGYPRDPSTAREQPNKPGPNLSFISTGHGHRLQTRHYPC